MQRRQFLKEILSVLILFSQKSFAHFVPFGFWKKQVPAPTLWCWGYNGSGALGDGTYTNRSSPAQIGALKNWSTISCGSNHTAAIKSDGTLWIWGNNECGNLGVTGGGRNSPVQVGSGTNWTSAVAAGEYTTVAKLYTMAVKADGTLWAWGDNSVGQLGDGTIVTKSSPIQIGSNTNWAQVTASYGLHTVAIKTDGSLWAWGSGGNGRTGLGDSINRSSPVQVGTSTDWAQVYAGQMHTMALKTDGTLWSWGSNANGQLGKTGASRSSPTQINSDTDWRSGSAGSTFSLAVKTNNTLWVWGSNYYGQLATGNNLDKSTPTQVPGTTWLEVSGGSDNTFAIKTDKTLWAWGGNDTGALGDGAIANRSSPVQVGSLGSWTKVSAGESFVSALLL